MGFRRLLVLNPGPPVPALALGEDQAGGQLGSLRITRLYFALCMRQRYIKPLACSLIFEQ